MMGPPPPPPPKGRRASDASGQPSSAGMEGGRAGRSLSSPGDPMFSPPGARGGKGLGLPIGNSSSSSLGDPHYGMKSPAGGVPPNGWARSGAPGGPGHLGHLGMGARGGQQMGSAGFMSPPLSSPAGHFPMGHQMHSPQGHMHGYGHHPASQQLMSLVKPPPSKRLEIVDPRRKSADAAVGGSSSSGGGAPAAAVAAAAGKGGRGQAQQQQQQQKRWGSEGGAVLGRRGSGGKAGGGDSADAASVLSL
jgi:hypothetical protein